MLVLASYFMKASHLILGTQRENPADAEIISHQLMIRAGLIRQVSSGIYNWLPLGKKVLQKSREYHQKRYERFRGSGNLDAYGPASFAVGRIWKN